MRLTKLRQKLADEGLDAILITEPANRRYFSGFTGTAGTLIISPDRAMLATDFRYYEQVERQAPQFELVEIKGKFPALLPELVDKLDVRRLGFESKNVHDRTRGGLGDGEFYAHAWCRKSGLSHHRGFRPQWRYASRSRF
jgi:Xaa-Pro aminopeptidase